MPSETGFWEQDEAVGQHDFCYNLAKYIGRYFPKTEPLIDFGCGPAEYLRYLHDIGFEKLLGYDGVKLKTTEFSNVVEQDLAVTFNAPTENIGNAICLEVGEHIPEKYLDIFIDNITRNVAPGGKLMLSWAVPNQDGYGHVSCRHNIWAMNELEKRGFTIILKDSLDARAVIEERFTYFRNTVMIFKKNK